MLAKQSGAVRDRYTRLLSVTCTLMGVRRDADENANERNREGLEISLSIAWTPCLSWLVFLINDAEWVGAAAYFIYSLTCYCRIFRCPGLPGVFPNHLIDHENTYVRRGWFGWVGPPRAG